GTILVVSHDRYFLDRVATRLVVMEDGKVRVVEGNYTSYRELREKEGDEADAAAPEKQDDYREQKRKRNEASKRQKRLREVEGEIALLERAVAELQKAMCDESLAFDWARLEKLDHEKRDKQKRLDGLMKDWESLSTEPA
ncbi:MAG: ABC transporter ATP-binding protein, partial [Planctomycetota bacterium]